MGLDSVELIQKIENHFVLLIPDQEADQMTTIRYLCEYKEQNGCGKGSPSAVGFITHRLL